MRNKAFICIQSAAGQFCQLSGNCRVTVGTDKSTPELSGKAMFARRSKEDRIVLYLVSASVAGQFCLLSENWQAIDVSDRTDKSTSMNTVKRKKIKVRGKHWKLHKESWEEGINLYPVCCRSILSIIRQLTSDCWDRQICSGVKWGKLCLGEEDEITE